MSADSGGLPCGQDVCLEISSGFEQNSKDLTTAIDLGLDSAILNQYDGKGQAEGPTALQEVTQDPKENSKVFVYDYEKATTSNIQTNTATRPRALYSDMFNRNDERESSTADFRRKNVVRLCFLGEEIPDREYVAKKLLIDSLIFSPLHVYVLIHVSGSREYDVSFRNSVFLEKIWEKYEKVKTESVWKDFIAVRISQANIKNITVLFKNESVPSLDILYWLQQRCTVLGDLSPIYDKYGFWVGGYKIRVHLHVTETGVQHLPNSILIGGDRGFLFYAGQPKVCFKCGSKRHMSMDCNNVTCNKCGKQGHSATDCQDNIVCNLCKKSGHAYLKCPDSARNCFSILPTVEE
nr:PREDICTED: zinc finger CCHC domain-containing protein 3-like [Latimeria chalumnae]|eukprot:XP_006012776.1 PREDICTED: zinc finger CCHC domain-containing protein 3-like [Latimeria chalumnae]